MGGLKVTPGTLYKTASRFGAGPIGTLTIMYFRGQRYPGGHFGIARAADWFGSGLACPEDLSDVRSSHPAQGSGI